MSFIEQELGGTVVLTPGLPGVAFTTRLGGVSTPPFDSLNLGFMTGDDLVSVSRNRSSVSATLEIPRRWATGRQVHGTEVLWATPELAEVSFDRRPEADAVLTEHPGLPVAVLAADCVPIALVGEGRVGAIHAGWRGLSSGLIEKALSQFGSAARACLGPSIGPCHYEVRSDVPDAFGADNRELPDFSSHREGRIFFDLRAAARWLLERAGAEVMMDEPPCTACDPRFYSHRRDGTTGRQALIVWRSGEVRRG